MDDGTLNIYTSGVVFEVLIILYFLEHMQKNVCTGSECLTFIFVKLITQKQQKLIIG